MASTTKATAQIVIAMAPIAIACAAWSSSVARKPRRFSHISAVAATAAPAQKTDSTRTLNHPGEKGSVASTRRITMSA